ncbi:MAG: hypothetical protein H7841_05950 [Magnetospirillum sp. WYHS-4]
MFPTRMLAVALLGLAVAGCETAATPVAVGHDATTQMEMLRVQHWDILASDVAAEIAEAAKKAPPGGGSYFVEPLDISMPFGRAFRDHLTTHLVKKGLPVTLVRAEAGYRVHTAVQPILHETSNRPATGSAFLAASALGGIHRLRDIGGFNLVTANMMVAGTALELANAGAFGYGANDEILITVTLLKGGDILSRNEAMYYIDRKEAFQYAGSAPAGPLGVALAGAPAQPLPIREFSINAP